MLLAFTVVASTSPAIVPAERYWLPFFQEEAREGDVLAKLGTPDQVDAVFPGGKLLVFKRAPGFPGGIEAWLDETGRVSDITFYVVPIGRAWTRKGKVAASKVVSAASLDDVLARYGRPAADKEGKGRRIGVRRLLYEEPAGTATRSVTFGSVPFTDGLHTITVTWDQP